jgi:hypothetical protein
MTAHEIAVLQTQVNMLDPQTARRVARLVLECRSSLAMALLAVQEADRAALANIPREPARRNRRGIWAALATGRGVAEMRWLR